eukprot:329677-Chlamydomonas_euryale.AAC.11
MTLLRPIQILVTPDGIVRRCETVLKPAGPVGLVTYDPPRVAACILSSLRPPIAPRSPCIWGRQEVIDRRACMTYHVPQNAVQTQTGSMDREENLPAKFVRACLPTSHPTSTRNAQHTDKHTHACTHVRAHTHTHTCPHLCQDHHTPPQLGQMGRHAASALAHGRALRVPHRTVTGHTAAWRP